METSRLRLALSKGLFGNLRLAEIMLHGETIGPAHPDALAKRPVAVLFDEGEDLKDAMIYGNSGIEFRFDGAYAGGRALSVRGDGGGGPRFQREVGHAVPHWDFEIVENPQPGQYRWLQFAWRALSPQTKGITLHLPYAGGLGFHAGEYSPSDNATPQKVAESPPAEWKTVRVDLWEKFKKPVRIQSLALYTKGGPAAFDQIVLGRSEADLPPMKGQ